MDEPELDGESLKAILAAEIRSAETYAEQLAVKRSLAVEYLSGVMSDVPARPNSFTLTSRDFPDTLAWVLPGVVRVFTGGDQMVKYDRVREENDDWCKDASEYMNYSFMSENNGYQLIYNSTYDGLAFGNGILCSYWEEAETETEWFRDKTEMELAALLEQGWKPTGIVKEGKPVIDDATGMEMPTLSAKLQREEKPARICDMTCKPENFLINSGAITIETARFVGYRHTDKTRSDLLEMADEYGWDKETIRNLPSYSRLTSNSSVQDSRFLDVTQDDRSPFKSGDAIDLYELYLRGDMDNDGIAEVNQCWYAGAAGAGELLGVEEWEDDVPFTDIPCYPIPHRWDAQGLFDRTADIQRAKTVLLRQGLDNTAAVNNPQREVEEGSVLNPDILINPKFGGLIWKKRGTSLIQPHVIPYIADKAFSAMQYMDEMIAKRTGVSRTTMALDPEALQNQTATAAAQQRDASYSQIELIARNMAELGWTKFFRKRLKLAINHKLVRQIPSKRQVAPQPQQQMPGMDMQQADVQQASPFREINAEQWDPNMAVTINVGLGTGSRDRDMAMLSSIQQDQMLMASTLADYGATAKAIEFLPKIRNTAVKKAESSGLRNPEEFYPEFTDEEIQRMQQAASQPPGPPEAVLVEQERQKGAAQLAQMNAQITMQTEQGKNQLAAQQAELAAQGDVVKNKAELEADLATREADRQNALILEASQQAFEREKLQAEYAFKAHELNVKTELEREKMANAATIAANKPEPQAKAN